MCASARWITTFTPTRRCPTPQALNDIPLKTEGQKSVFISDVGKAVDGSALQYNIVRVDGQKSVYVPIQKQGGDTNTIAVVNGIKNAIKTLRDIPSQLKTHVVFDQSLFVKQAISTVLREGGIGLLLTGAYDSDFSGQLSRHGRRVSFDSAFGHGRRFSSFIPANEIDRQHGPQRAGSGLFAPHRQLRRRSRKYFPPYRAGRRSRQSPPSTAPTKSALAVLAITIVTVVVFFPVTFLFGVSKYLFTALALAVVIALFASYFVAVSVVPLYCAEILRGIAHHARSG